MNKLTISSDGKKISVSVDKDNLSIISKKETTVIPLDKINKVYVDNRKNKYKPDLFFIVYTLFSSIIGIGILYLLFKNERKINMLQTGIAFIIIVGFATLLMIIAANRKSSLFVTYKNKTLEIPLDNRDEIDPLIKLLKNLGIKILYSKQG